jgi:peptidoglycan/LPS O-acetylase OafA/YrhL
VNTGWRTTLSYASFLITVGTFLVLHEFILPNGEWDWRALGALVAIGVGGSMLLTAAHELRRDEGSGLSLALLLPGAVLAPLGIYLGATAEQGWRFLGGSLAALIMLGLVGGLLPEEEDEQADEEYSLRDGQFDEELLRNPRVF